MRKVMIVASSLDGYIAQSREQVSTAWTSSEDKQWFGQITRELGVMVMGGPTYETIGRPLPERKLIVMTLEEELDGARSIADFDLESKDGLYQARSMSVQEVVAALAEKDAKQMAICGGATIYREFLLAGEVDEIYLTLEPVLFGGGVKLLGEGPCRHPIQLELITKIELSMQTTVLHLRVKGLQK